MKRVYLLLLVVIAAGTIAITGCKKNQDKPADTSAVIISSEGLVNDQSFVKLSDAISRFDPKYLQLVYKDKRTEAEITKASMELLQELSANPENTASQQKLANFYHFKTVEEMKSFSAGITENLKVLDKKYDLRKSVMTGNGGKLFFKARGQLAKEKIDHYPNNARQTNGLWTEFVDQYFSEFDYNTYVYDESMEEALEGGGGEICAIDRDICKANARNKYVDNLVKYGAGGAASAGAIGAAGGSFFPAVGTVAGGVIFGIFGGIGGSLAATIIYSNDLEICRLNYLKCLELQKKG